MVGVGQFGVGKLGDRAKAIWGHNESGFIHSRVSWQVFFSGVSAQYERLRNDRQREIVSIAAFRDVISYLTSAEVQEKMALQLATTPVDKTVLASPALKHNPALMASMEQIAHGRPMPIRPQMRQIWEGMRGPYQLVMNGAITAKEAAHRMQREAEKNIADSNLLRSASLNRRGQSLRYRGGRRSGPRFNLRPGG
jgi:hypothetical protein